MDFAFDEFWSLSSRLGGQDSHQVENYLCALVAELAYYHVPQFEFDAPKRAKLMVPSSGYQRITRTGARADVVGYLRGLDFSQSFVAVDRGIVAVGIVAGRKLYIGFRGTAFLFDWRINLTAPLVPVVGTFPTMLGVLLWPGAGRLHRGFAEEAVRISARIVEEWERVGNGSVEEVFLSGHSLGGAIAAISEGLLRGIGNSISTRLFGSPRYADVGHYYSRRGPLPLQIRRLGDIVPSIPPKRMGYVDHPREHDTSGNSWMMPEASGVSFFLWRAALFIGRGFAAHDVEKYRQELGNTCGAKFANKSLTDYQRLTNADVCASG